MVAWGLEWSFSTKTPWKLINIQTPARALLSPRHPMHFLTINESLYCSVSLALQRTTLIPRKKPSLATRARRDALRPQTQHSRQTISCGRKPTNKMMNPSSKCFSALHHENLCASKRIRAGVKWKEREREWQRRSKRLARRLSLAHLYAQTSGQRYHDTGCEWHPLGGIPTMPRVGSLLFFPSCFSEWISTNENRLRICQDRHKQAHDLISESNRASILLQFQSFSLHFPLHCNKLPTQQWKKGWVTIIALPN